MKKPVLYFLICTLVMFSLSGCATICKGNTDPVRFNSDPEGAKVYINGELYGHTPLKLRLRADRSYVIEFHKAGFEPVIRHINSRVGAGWVVLDVLMGMVPVVVDALTGSWYHLDQRHVNVVLGAQQP